MPISNRSCDVTRVKLILMVKVPSDSELGPGTDPFRVGGSLNLTTLRTNAGLTVSSA